MATIGGFIAMSFVLAMLIGPVLGAQWGVDKLFELTALLAILASLVLAFFVPKPPVYKNLSTKTTFGSLFENRSLNLMYLFIFFHGFLLTNMFFILPLELTRHFGWSTMDAWRLYVPSTILGMIAMVPAAILSEKRGYFKQVTIIGVALFFIGFTVCAIAVSPLMFCVGGVVFFIGFNMLEPILQSAASKYAKAALRGKALATFTSFQYLGVFIGGILGGFLMHLIGSTGLLWGLVVVAGIWLIFAIFMTKPPLAGFAFFNLHKIDNTKIVVLETTNGILDFYANEETVTVKFDKKLISQIEVEAILFKTEQQ
jgi:MFS family permease